MLEMRTSERRSLKHCAQQWYWSSVEELRPNRAANPLWFGSAVHVALADWYREGLTRGPHPAETFQNFLDGERSMLVTNEDNEEEYFDARELGTDMLTRYIEMYQEDATWKMVATEHAGKIVLPRPERKVFGKMYPRLENWLTYHFTWDGIFQDLEDGQFYLAEHKTAASIQLGHLPLDDQSGSYWAIASHELQKQGILKRGQEIVGIRYNFLRKALTDTRPRDAEGYYTNKPQKQHYIDAIGDGLTGKETLARLEEIAAELDITVLGEVSKSQPPAFFERHDVFRSREERRTQFRRIQDEALFSEAYRKGYLPITKNPTRDCSWCAYQRMCQLDEAGDQDAVEIFKETQYHKESPYEVYRTKSTES